VNKSVNKKVNTAAFILAATITNVLFMSLLFLLAYSVYQILAGRRLSPGINLVAVFILFVGSVALTYFVHRHLVKLLLKKTSLGKILWPGGARDTNKNSPPRDAG
jgi:predicted membrane protein